MIKSKIIALGLISFILLLHACKKDKEIKNEKQFEDFLLDEMESQNIPALSVLIFKEDDVLFEKYLGQSNISQNKALAENDLFLLASISKVVTATALLQLYDDGLFELDDAINDYLPFDVNHPDYGTPITFKMLLTHTSGIADGSALDNQYYYGTDSPVTLNYFLENYLVPSGVFYNVDENFYNFKPGTEHEYSNIGSALIGLLVEKISNTDFNTYCKNNIFIPLGMENTFWRLDESFQSNNPLVQPYNYVGKEYESIQHYTFTDYPNGGLRSTGKDLHRLIMAFMNNGNSNNHQLLKSSTVNLMTSPQISSIDAEVGLHMFMMNTEENLWGHDGGEQGVATIMAFHKDTKVGAIILCNQGEADLDEILLESYKIGLKL